MKQKGFAPIIIVLVLAAVGILVFILLKDRAIQLSLLTATTSPVINPTSIATEPTPSTTTTKKLGYIKVLTNSKDIYEMQIDYVESVLPDDVRGGYRLKNTSNETTTVSVDPNASVTMQTYSKVPDGNFVPNQFITLDKLVEAFNSGADIRNSPYWVESENGRIVKILEQYIP